MTRDRMGFTMVELIVVTVLGSIVVAAALQVLIVNQRTYTAQAATISGQQSTRMAFDVLFNELREVSPSGGDILAMSADSIRARLQRKFGFVCATNFTAQPILNVIPWGTGTNAFEVGDSVFVFADNDESIDTDDAWISARVTAVVAGACPQDGVTSQLLTFNGQGPLFAADSVGIGAPLRSFDVFTFGTTALLGNRYLGRRPGNGDMIPVAGPIWNTAFTFRDAFGATTAAPADVRQIEVTVRTGSDVLTQAGGMVRDSIRTWIYTRN